MALDGIRFYSALLVFLVHAIGAISHDIFRIPESEFTPHAANAAQAIWALVLGGVSFFIAAACSLRVTEPKVVP
jgi:peptidoglycan/LPS O-acetylase OafA/YrhL